jgi:hypothetical protein
MNLDSIATWKLKRGFLASTDSSNKLNPDNITISKHNPKKHILAMISIARRFASHSSKPSIHTPQMLKIASEYPLLTQMGTLTFNYSHMSTLRLETCSIPKHSRAITMNC